MFVQPSEQFSLIKAGSYISTPFFFLPRTHLLASTKEEQKGVKMDQKIEDFPPIFFLRVKLPEYF